MENLNVAENKTLAYLWFLLAFICLAISILAIRTSGIFIVPGIWGMSAILIIVGRQRLSQCQLERNQFNSLVRKIALVTSIWCGVSVAVELHVR